MGGSLLELDLINNGIVLQLQQSYTSVSLLHLHAAELCYLPCFKQCLYSYLVQTGWCIQLSRLPSIGALRVNFHWSAHRLMSIGTSRIGVTYGATIEYQCWLFITTVLHPWQAKSFKLFTKLLQPNVVFLMEFMKRIHIHIEYASTSKYPVLIIVYCNEQVQLWFSFFMLVTEAKMTS